MKMVRTFVAFLVLGVSFVASAHAGADRVEYRVLATSKTSTMQKELNEAADLGFRFASVMGGETSYGGSEVVAVMQKIPGASHYEYRLLATSKTSTMQKEIRDAADAGFYYVGQSVFKSTFGGSEVVCILERDPSGKERWEYRLLATSKTSTMQKELQEVGDQAFQIVGMTVAQTALGGRELVSIMRRKVK